jgi:hypothetical protein
MSAEGDDYGTGTPDLVEQTRANSSSARSRGGGSHPSRPNRTESNTIAIPPNRGRGKINGRNGGGSRMKNGHKVENQVFFSCGSSEIL